MLRFSSHDPLNKPDYFAVFGTTSVGRGSGRNALMMKTGASHASTRNAPAKQFQQMA